MGDGQWAMGNGRWAMGNGQWAMGNGRWAMGNGQRRWTSLVVIAVAVVVGAAACSSFMPSSDIPPPPDVAAPPSDSLKTTTGLSIKWLQRGAEGRHPRATDRVTVHYTGWTTDGKMFDSSIARAEAATFRLDEVIAGWTEALQRMAAGDKVRVWIPEELAYRGKDPKGMLVFDIELIKIE
jgi:peptidylprolyl isomerase